MGGNQSGGYGGGDSGSGGYGGDSGGDSGSGGKLACCNLPQLADADAFGTGGLKDKVMGKVEGMMGKHGSSGDSGSGGYGGDSGSNNY